MKTEKQKAAEGLLYDANNDPELQREMLQTRCLLHEYNLLPPDRTDERDRLIRRIVHMGEGGCIISPFYCDYGYHIRIGRNFFANTNLVILDGADVTIGDNVWIGGNCVVMQGETIGDGTVIGAGSVVTHDIPDGVLAAGNPCRVIRKITEADALKHLAREEL